MSIRWVSVVEFHHPALSIGKGFGQESTVVKWNYQILSLHLVTVCLKVPILDFQSEFSMTKIVRIFLNFFSLKNISLEEGFLLSFFENFNFWTNLFPKMVPNFWQSVWTSVKVKSKKYFSFSDLFAKIKLLFTHLRKTPLLRSH